MTTLYHQGHIDDLLAVNMSNKLLLTGLYCHSQLRISRVLAPTLPEIFQQGLHLGQRSKVKNLNKEAKGTTFTQSLGRRKAGSKLLIKGIFMEKRGKN